MPIMITSYVRGFKKKTIQMPIVVLRVMAIAQKTEEII